MASAAPVSDPWETARNRYLANLEPEEEILFKEATPQNLYYNTSNIEREDRVKSKTRNAMASVQPLVEKIEEYGKAMDTFANAAPEILSPLWGSLRVILVLARSFTRFYERMTNTLGRVGDILPRLFDFQRIFSQNKHPRLNEAIAKTYLDIIELCTDFRSMIKAQQKSLIKRAVHPLSSSVEQKFKDAETKFRSHKKNVEKEAELCNMIEAAEERALVLRDRQLQQMNDKVQLKKKLLAILSEVSGVQKHAKIRSTRQENTGTWLFEREEWNLWYKSCEQSIICCYGIPGCGKTTLTSSVIDYLLSALEDKKAVIGYHYCDYGDKRTLDPNAIFGGLIRTIFELNEFPTRIVELINDYYHDGERVPEMKEVLHIFFKTIDEFESVVLVIDGIDEVKEQDLQKVYEAIQALTVPRDSSGSVKIFVSCREDVGNSIFSSHQSTFSVPVTREAILSDIENFVRQSVSTLLSSGKMVIRATELKEEIVTILVSGAQGMFLWVVFQLSELCTAESDDGLRAILKNLPKDLSETYDRLLGQIIGAERQDLVSRLFRWIICARRPLFIDELCEAIAFTIEDKFWNSDKIPTSIIRLIRACGNLVVLDEETGTVQLAHYTVQQYILKAQNYGNNPFHFDVQQGEQLLGEVCVAYLNFSDFETQVTVHKDSGTTAKFTAMELAVSGGHLQSLVIPHIASSNLMRRVFSNTQREPSRISYDQYVPTKNYQGDSTPENYCLLSYVKENWLWHTAQFLPNDRRNRRDTLFYNLVSEKDLPFPFKPWDLRRNLSKKYSLIGALGWALVTNHCPLVRVLLIEHPSFDIEACLLDAAQWTYGANSEPPVFYFSEQMSETINNCDVDSWDSNSTPKYGWLYSKLLTACSRGNIKILKLCFTKSLSLVKTPHEAYLSRLYSHLKSEAAACNQLEIVEYFESLFLDKDFLVGEREIPLYVIQRGIALNALDRATISGHLRVAIFLASKGWRLSGLRGHKEEVLERVIEEGKKNILETLHEVYRFDGNMDLILSAAALYRYTISPIFPSAYTTLISVLP